MDRAEAMTRARLSEIPDGSYTCVDYLDNDGVDLDQHALAGDALDHPHLVRRIEGLAAVDQRQVADGDCVEVDHIFAGDQVRGGVGGRPLLAPRGTQGVGAPTADEGVVAGPQQGRPGCGRRVGVTGGRTSPFPGAPPVRAVGSNLPARKGLPPLSRC